MNLVKRLIRWITPTGWTIRQLQYYRDEFRASGVLNWGHDEELQIYKLKPTYWHGVFLAYSKDEYNKEVHYAINDLKYQIKQLEDKLR